jgi:uncharacterized integral membrane protein (TIGR00698 family)
MTAESSCQSGPAAPASTGLHGLMGLAPGLAVSGAVATSAIALGRIGWLQDHGFSALTLAIVLGMLAGNTVYPRIALVCGAGVSFARQTLLRLGIVLYGLRLTVQDIGHVGYAGVATDALVLGSTFALACFIGMRWLGMDRKTAMLIGAGSSICGAAAVMASGPVIKANAEQVTVAVATVVVFGTLAIFLYPALFEINRHWQLVPGGANGFGIYVGSTIHEVAQVVAAARSVGTDAADTAVIAKMVRVMMLAPFLIMLSAWLARDDARRLLQVGPAAASPALRSYGSHAESLASPVKTRLAVPWFAFAFVGVVLFNSMNLLPPGAIAFIIEIDTILLATAMAALGLATHVSSIRKAGIKPLLLALGLFVWLVIGGALINRWVYTLLA